MGKRAKVKAKVKLERNKSIIFYVLLVAIVAGSMMRVYGLGSEFLTRDEMIYATAAIKHTHNNPFDPRLFNWEHPPVAKWILGLPTKFIEADYDLVLGVPPQMYVYTYMVPSEVLDVMKMVSALFGLLSLLLIFLIVKELYGERPALWSTAIAALSSDLIGVSRLIYLDSITIGLILATVYSFIKYQKTEKSVYVLATIVLTILTMGSKALFPWLLVPGLIIATLASRDKNLQENVIFLFLIFLGVYLAFFVIWTPENLKMARGHYQAESSLGIVELSAGKNLLWTLFRNSHLFLTALIIGVYYLSKKIKEEKDVIKWVIKRLRDPDGIVISLFLLNAALFSFTRYKYQYLIYLFTFLFLLLGVPLANLAKKRNVRYILIGIILLDIVMLSKFYPYFLEYTNFGGVEEYKYLSITSGYYDHTPEIKETLIYLEGLSNPPILTNEHNILKFYEGIAIPLVAPHEGRCNSDYIKKTITPNTYFVYHGAYAGSRDIREDPYVCNLVRVLPLELVDSFGEYPDKNKPRAIEIRKVKIYRIKGG